MATTTIAEPAVARRDDPAASRVRASALPRYALALVFASTSIVVGLIWDISWHMTIGRDTFWTPAHVATYLGGIVAGLSSGLVVLATTFRGPEAARAASVRVWGFRGPLGAWVCIWGAATMLVSAPFDDWWHGAYGLDVQIISPPHTVLALGIGAIAVGGMLYTLALQNRAGRASRALNWAFAYCLGVILILHSVMTAEYSWWTLMHSSVFYRVSALAFPAVLAAATRASKLAWPATAIAAVYTAARLLMLWILPLFPAEPKLGPIYQHVTQMVPMDFPLLLLAPALAMDLVARRGRGRGWGDWRTAALLGTAFFVVFLVAQWPFAEFLRSPLSMNRVFGTHFYYYGLPNSSPMYQRVLPIYDPTVRALIVGLAAALPLAILTSRVGLAAGAWMSRVRR